jgi:hypothetical protein
MARRTLRRFGALITAAGLAGLAALVASAPASATPTPIGLFYFKPAGSSAYSLVPPFQGVAPGSSTTFQIKLVNVGDAAGQFNIALDQFSGGPASQEGLYPPTVTMTANGAPVPTDGWITPILAPGGAQVVNVKVAVPNFVLQSGAYGFDIDENWVGQPGGFSSQFFSVVVAQSSGSSAADVFVKTGYQPFVGGWIFGNPPENGDYPIESVNVLRRGSSGSATIRLQNDSPTAATIGLQATDVCGFDTTSAFSTWPITITDGFKNVTAAVLAGSYVTPMLKPNAHRDLRLIIKDNASPSCISGQVILTTSGQGQSMVAGVMAGDAA